MKSTANIKNSSKTQITWFDTFTKTMLLVMIIILMCIFAAGKYMNSHKMEAQGTDGTVNNLASQVTGATHHPFIELPGDAEVGAFSVANFFAGLIIGHNFEKLFGKAKGANEKSTEAE